MSIEELRVLHPGKYLHHHLEEKIRPDGRNFNEYRPISLDLDSIKTADGSALAKIGETTVVCGIKAELCRPRADQPNSGFLVPNVELPPLCSSKFRPGPPSDTAQIATQLLDDLIRNSGCCPLTQLCIYSDKLVWCLYIDLVCLNYGGALIDCCSVALTAALQTVTLPQVKYDPVLDLKRVDISKRHPLQIEMVPIATTFALFEMDPENCICLMDPTVEEEDLCNGGLLTLICDSNRKWSMIYKPGGCSTTRNRIQKCMFLSKQRISNIEQFITNTFYKRNQIKSSLT